MRKLKFRTGPNFSAQPLPGLRCLRAGVIAVVLGVTLSAPAQLQYRDRNGETWSSSTQIDRQMAEDNRAQWNANSSSSASSEPSYNSTHFSIWRNEKMEKEEEVRLAQWARENDKRLADVRKRAQENWVNPWAEEAARRAREAREAERAKEAERKGVEAVVAGFREKYTVEQRQLAAEILSAAQAGKFLDRDSRLNYDVVAGLAEGLLTGFFRGRSLAELEINYSVPERYELALKLFGAANGHYGRQQNRGGAAFEAGAFEAGAFDPDPISPAALLVLGRGDQVMRKMREKPYISGPKDWLDIFAGLGCALAMPKSDLEPEQRQQATDLVADYMGRASVTGDDGAALAGILVRAAERTPELLRVKVLHEKFIPQVRDSIWATGFKSWPSPIADAEPLVVKGTGTTYWNLSAMLILAQGYQTPVRWFADLRDERRKRHLTPATAADKVTVQRALDGWFARSGVSAGVRQAIQADCDLACDASEAGLAGSAKWDDETQGGMANLILEVRRAAGLAALRNPDFLQQPGAKSFLATAPFKDEGEDGLVTTFLGEACADGPDRSARALLALRWLTDIDDAFSFYEMPRARWEALVTLGEGFCAAGDKQWIDPIVSARLARIRNARLGDEVAAMRWLSEPKHQPGDLDAPEKWRAWAALAGRPGITIAAKRHPEHFMEPALLTQSLVNLIRGTGGVLSQDVRHAVKALLVHTKDITDATNVLTIAKIRGPLLGDWARLGDWLDDPSRRPKDKNDPLYPIFIFAIIERDQASGFLTENLFDSNSNWEASQELEKWLEAVLAAKGEERTQLIETNFPSVIYCPGAASPHPDLRMLGYDAMHGSFASRALLLLSTAEFDPEQKFIAGFVMVDGADGKPEKIGGYDPEPWLAAVAKLPRKVTPEALLTELSAGVKARRSYLEPPVVAAPVRPETKPRELTEEEESRLREKEHREMLEDRRTRWVGEGCQDTLARLAGRWSPAREPAQAIILGLGENVILQDDRDPVNPKLIAVRVAWERCKMKGLDDAEAFASATTGLTRADLVTLESLCRPKSMNDVLVLWKDERFVQAVVASVASPEK